MDHKNNLDDEELVGHILDSIKSMEPVNGIDQLDFFNRLPLSAERKNGVLAAFWRARVAEDERKKDAALADENLPLAPPKLERSNSVDDKFKYTEAKSWSVPDSER